MMLIMTVMNMIKIIIDADVDDRNDDDDHDAADDTANRRTVVSVTCYKPLFCRNRANTAVSRNF